MDVSNAFNMERSKRDVEFFYKWLGYTWGEHIGEWMEMYGDRKGAEVHRTCIIAPRDHSKSTTLRVKLLHQCLFDTWRNKPFTVWLFSASKDLAARRIEEIREDLKRHPQLSRYLDTKRGTKLELRLTNGAWIRGTGVGAAIRGEHPACIAMDDVLDDTGDMDWGTIRHWFRKKVTPMLSPKTSLYVVGTPMSMNDLYHSEMIDNPVWKSGVWSAFKNWDEYKSDPDNVVLDTLWPEYRSKAFLLEQKAAMGELAFVQEYLCRVVDDEAAVYKRELTRKNLDMDSVLEHEKLHGGKYAIGFDPAHGVGKDYSVMICMRQADNGDIHFVNMWRRNDFPPDKQADMVGEWNKRYKMPTFAVEDVGFQRMYESLLANKKIVIDYKASKVSNKSLKQGILNRLRVWFERQKIIFPFGDDSTRKIVNIILSELECHVWKEGDIVDVGRHNDTVMALAHAVDQFSIPEGKSPMVFTTVEGSDWIGKKGNFNKYKTNRGIGGRIARMGRRRR